MRVAALTPFLSELTRALVGEGSLCATVDPSHTNIKYNTKFVGTAISQKMNLLHSLSQSVIDVEALKEASPDYILTTLAEPEMLSILREELFKVFGRQIFLHHFDPIRLDDVLSMFENLGRILKVPDKGRTLASKMKAQFMDWSASFYQRTKNKKVTVITSLDPLTIGGRWIPDMIKMSSGVSEAGFGLREDKLVLWSDIIAFNPDVILIAPKNLSYAESLKTFPKLNQISGWENIYAVKRGDVYFTDGTKFFLEPTVKLIASMGILISAMAGLESGYITERDTIYKLRYLELHRHTFLK